MLLTEAWLGLVRSVRFHFARCWVDARGGLTRPGRYHRRDEFPRAPAPTRGTAVFDLQSRSSSPPDTASSARARREFRPGKSRPPPEALVARGSPPIRA